MSIDVELVILLIGFLILLAAIVAKLVDDYLKGKAKD